MVLEGKVKWDWEIDIKNNHQTIKHNKYLDYFHDFSDTEGSFCRNEWFLSHEHFLN